MRIVQKIFPDQAFKISLSRILLQLIEEAADIQIRPDRSVIVQPGVQYIQAVDQALRIRTEVRLAVVELIVVDSGEQRLPVDAMLRKFLQRLPDGLQEVLLLLRIRVLGRHGVIRLINAALVEGLHVLADSSLPKSLLEGRSLRVAQHVVEHLERQNFLRVSVNRQRRIPGKERLSGRILFF